MGDKYRIYRYRLFIHISAQNKQLIFYWVQVLYGRNRDIREILRKSEWLIRGLETRKDWQFTGN